jgi:two-component system sensor kinase FixL
MDAIPSQLSAPEGDRMAEAELGRMLDTSLNEIYVFDATTLIFRRVNRGAIENLGYNTEELASMSPVDLTPDLSAGEFSAIVQQLRDGEINNLRFETRHRRKDGSLYNVDIDLQLGTYHGHPAFFSIALDSTARKQTEEALHDREERNRSVLDMEVHAIVTMGEDRRIESVNPATERMFGYTAEELVGENVKILMPSPYRERHDGFVDAYSHTGKQRIIGIGREMVGQHKDGTIFPIDLSVDEAELSSGKRLFTGIIRDISEYKRLENKLISVSEQERRCIGHEIHDDLCQRLFGIGCLIGVLQRKLTDIPDHAREALVELAKLAGSASAQARHMAHGLMPVGIEADGLMAALGELASTTEKSSGVRCHYHCDAPVLIDKNDTATQLYRIAQEATANAVKHGRPRRIDISLKSVGANTVLEISDDGQGLPTRAKRELGIGMLTMAHRARMLGGHCEIANRDGAVVTCSIPNHTTSKDDEQ